MQDVTEFLTAAELAGRLRVRVETVRRWTRNAMIPAIRMTGKVVRYDPAEVEHALRERSDAQGTSPRGARKR